MWSVAGIGESHLSSPSLPLFFFFFFFSLKMYRILKLPSRVSGGAPAGEIKGDHFDYVPEYLISILNKIISADLLSCCSCRLTFLVKLRCSHAFIWQIKWLFCTEFCCKGSGGDGSPRLVGRGHGRRSQPLKQRRSPGRCGSDHHHFSQWRKRLGAELSRLWRVRGVSWQAGAEGTSGDGSSAGVSPLYGGRLRQTVYHPQESQPTQPERQLTQAPVGDSRRPAPSPVSDDVTRTCPVNQTSSNKKSQRATEMNWSSNALL